MGPLQIRNGRELTFITLAGHAEIQFKIKKKTKMGKVKMCFTTLLIHVLHHITSFLCTFRMIWSLYSCRL